MSTQLATEIRTVRRRRSICARAVAMLGPLTVVAGTVWAILQPYRLTLLHPRGEDFWWLLVEPPLLVVLAGIFFHAVVAPGVIEDLTRAEEEG